MGARWEEDTIVLRLIGQPLTAVTGVVGRPWCRICAFNGKQKMISASIGFSKNFLEGSLPWCGATGVDD